MTTKIRILLVDEHSLFRESLSRLLQTEADLQIAGGCASAAEALSMPLLKEIDVVLLDYDLGEEPGTCFLEKAHSFGFGGRVLRVTAGMDDMTMLRALRCSSGVFLKRSPPSDLVEAIRKVAAGEMWLDPGIARSILTAATGAHPSERDSHRLTEREQSVLKGVFEGLTSKEIGARLSVSESSVKAALQQLFDKTGVRTRSQLMRIAFERYSHDCPAA